MSIFKLFGKLVLIPVWIILAAVGLILSIIVSVYNWGRGVSSVLLIVMMIATMLCYQDWLQVAILSCLYVILFALLFFGVAIEVILWRVRKKVENLILA